MNKTPRCLVALLVLGASTALADTAAPCPNVPPDGDADAFYEVVETAVTTEQLMEMVAV